MTTIIGKLSLSEILRLNKNLIITAVISAIIGYNLNFKEPETILKTEYLHLNDEKQSEKSSLTTKEKKKETKPDGSIVETETDFTLDVDKFFEKRSEIILNQELRVSNEPKWIVGLSTSLEWGSLKPTYGVSFGGKIKYFDKTYWETELWPVEKRVEASIKKLL